VAKVSILPYGPKMIASVRRTFASTLERLRQGPVAFARKHALALRMVIAVVVSLGFLLFASEAFFARAASSALIEQDARSYVADANALEIAYQEGSGPADAIDDVLDLVDSMEDRLGIDSAKLLDSDGKVVIAARDANLDSDRGTRTARGVGPSYADVETHDVGQGFQFVVPIHLGGKRFQLRVEADGQLLHARVSAMRNEALIFSVVSLLIGMGLFYVVGGRTLARRHRLVVKRATRDSLTDLGNHRSFQDELARAVAVAARREEPLALAMVDLNDFKFTNDRYGHQRGDEVLLEVAGVLSSGRPEDRAFRIGGDEFALLLPGTNGAEARVGLERRIATARAGATDAVFTIGVAVLPASSEIDSAVLREQADAALYEGKRTGSDIVVFDDVAELLSIVTPAKTHALRSLLDEPRIETAFQPIWDLQDGRVLGLEALTRPWAGYGFDGPADMFTVAEKIGRAHELDAVCRSTTLARAHEIPKGVLLFLNLNPQSLTHGQLGGDRLLHEVAAAGLDPSQVVLEITERSEARLSQVVADATRLRRLGFRIALDDVGAGNAGLEMLRELPVDFVKIDHSIIATAQEDVHAQAVLLAIIAYAGRAGAYVIAEGIESEQILTFVQNADELRLVNGPPIKGGQGYLLGRPNPDISQLVALPQIKARKLPPRPLAPAARRLAPVNIASPRKAAR
jgi:diguanylate cyclase (GGDEF)-like protein